MDQKDSRDQEVDLGQGHGQAQDSARDHGVARDRDPALDHATHLDQEATQATDQEKQWDSKTEVVAEAEELPLWIMADQMEITAHLKRNQQERKWKNLGLMVAQVAFPESTSLTDLNRATGHVRSVKKSLMKMKIGTMHSTVTSARKRGENACKFSASMLAKDD